jgi:imidazole glycerol-phosphate synthase subunit HisF
VAAIRLIARLDIKAPNLIKTINLEGVRVVGDPQVYARRYYEQGIDEIIYMDSVASLYKRNTIVELVERTAENVFIPITGGGGIRSVDDARSLLRAGADKVAINTAATLHPELITEIATRFGSQCMVLSIEAKKGDDGHWEAYRDGGREHTGLNVVEWARQGQDLGAGEILLTSVDREGMARGFDVDLISAVADAVSIPVIASGGMGAIEHLFEAVHVGGANGVAMAYILHYDKMTLGHIREQAKTGGLQVRSIR